MQDLPQDVTALIVAFTTNSKKIFSALCCTSKTARSCYVSLLRSVKIDYDTKESNSARIFVGAELTSISIEGVPTGVQEWQALQKLLLHAETLSWSIFNDDMSPEQHAAVNAHLPQLGESMKSIKLLTFQESYRWSNMFTEALVHWLTHMVELQSLTCSATPLFCLLNKQTPSSQTYPKLRNLCVSVFGEPCFLEAKMRKNLGVFFPYLETLALRSCFFDYMRQGKLDLASFQGFCLEESQGMPENFKSLDNLMVTVPIDCAMFTLPFFAYWLSMNCAEKDPELSTWLLDRVSNDAHLKSEYSHYILAVHLYTLASDTIHHQFAPHDRESTDDTFIRRLLNSGVYSMREFTMQRIVAEETLHLNIIHFAMMFASQNIVHALIEHVEASSGSNFLADIRSSSGFLPLVFVPRTYETWNLVYEKIRSVHPQVLLDRSNTKAISILQAIHDPRFRSRFRFDDTVRIYQRIVEQCPEALNITEAIGTPSLFSAVLAYHIDVWLYVPDFSPSLDKIDVTIASPILERVLEARYPTWRQAKRLADLGIITAGERHLFGMLVMLPNVFNKVYKSASPSERGECIRLLFTFYDSIQKHHAIIHEMLDLGVSMRDDTLKLLVKYGRHCPQRFWDLFWRFIDEHGLPFVNPIEGQIPTALFLILCRSPEQHLRRFVAHMAQLKIAPLEKLKIGQSLDSLLIACKLLTSGQAQFEEGVPSFVSSLEVTIEHHLQGLVQELSSHF